MVDSQLSRMVENPASKHGRITSFLRWWGAELRAMTPPRLAVLLGLSHEIMLLVPEGDDFTVQQLRGAGEQPFGRLSQPGIGDQLTRRCAGGAECVLRLPAGQGLRRQASIAVSALPRGFDAVAGEIERQTPFSLDQVYLGYRVEDAVDARGRVMAHLALVPCASADALLRRLADAGVTPDRICLADDTGVNPVGDTVHILTLPRRNPPPKALLAAACVLFLLAMASPHWRNASTLSGIQAELAVARQTALAETDRQNDAGDVSAMMAFVSQQRLQRPPVTALLNAISAALPDSAHLAQYELSGHTVALQGVAASAPELIAPLEALSFVAKVEFTAPTLRDPVTNQEQFQLSLMLRGAPAAERVE